MRFYFLILTLFFAISSKAQLMGFNLPKGKNKVEIPFEFRNNFIVVNLIFDDVFPLKFIRNATRLCIFTNFQTNSGG